MPQITMMLLMIAPAPINLLAEYVEHGGFVNILKGLDDSLVKNGISSGMFFFQPTLF